MTDTDYLELWWQDALKTCRQADTARRLQSSEAWGRVRRHVVYPRFGAVRLKIEPADRFTIANALNAEMQSKLEELDGEHQIAFGVLDVLLPRGLCSARITILEIEYHPVESIPYFYRWAAREATEKILRGES